ncbi:MAG: hypothetical protein JW760_07265 [Spirochaetales bacterium]|nr:hypothetical protein [Spirochaetales bacterium]
MARRVLLGRIVPVVFLLFITLALLPAQTSIDEGIVVPDAGISALGGYHTTRTEGVSTLFTNPAGFNTVTPHLAFSDLTLHLKGPVFDITNLVVSSLSGGAMGDLLTDEATLNLLRGIYAGLDLSGPVSFAYVGDGLGFGIFNVTDVLFQGIGPMTLQAKIIEQVILCGGYSFRIPLGSSSHNLDLGMLLKGTLRGESVITKSLLELTTLFSSLGADTILNEPFDFISAIGIDAGVLYSYKDVLSFGFVCDDLFTPILTNSYDSLQAFIDSAEVSPVQGRVPLKLNAGLGWTPRLGTLGRYISDLSLMLDYYDILDFLVAPSSAVNPLLHIGFGVELRLLDILSLRGGFNQGLFSAGLGLDLTHFTIDAAMFGAELGTEPGLQPVYNLIIGIHFGT